MNKKILIIEDNPLNIKLLDDYLTAKGYEIHIIERGDKALETAQNIKPDLILLDMNLPGKDGWSVARFLKTDPELKHIPIIVVTAYAIQYLKEKALKAGCEDYITKPIDLQELIKKIKHYIGN